MRKSLFLILILLLIPLQTHAVPGSSVPPTAAQWQSVTVTAYCSCQLCCNKTDGITASGTQATVNRTVAADTSQFPFGTQLYIIGVGLLTVEDTGGAIHRDRLDVFMNSHEEAIQFGVKHTYVKEKAPWATTLNSLVKTLTP